MKRIFTISNLLILYWSTFWLMNGLDKFPCGKNIGIFTWKGKDRYEQFGNYFSNTGISESWIQPLLYFTGIWEILIFIPLATTLWIQVFDSRFSETSFNRGMLFGGLTFVVFSIFDVVFGDRAELLEHSTFLILICITYRLIFDYSNIKNERFDKNHIRLLPNSITVTPEIRLTNASSSFRG